MSLRDHSRRTRTRLMPLANRGRSTKIRKNTRDNPRHCKAGRGEVEGVKNDRPLCDPTCPTFDHHLICHICWNMEKTTQCADRKAAMTLLRTFFARDQCKKRDSVVLVLWVPTSPARIRDFPTPSALAPCWCPSA